MWEIAVHLDAAGGVLHGVFLCCPFTQRASGAKMTSFWHQMPTGNPRDVLDEILDLTESVSEGFPTYFYTFIFTD